MKEPVFTGSGVALITPFTKENQIDYEAFASLLEFQIAEGTDAIIVCGTTGEASTLSRAERQQLIAFAVRQTAGRVPVIAGSGSNSTENAIAFSQDAQQAGADALLVVTPYYNKATQAGLQRHYNAIANAVALPLILYNVPSRTGVCFTAETYKKLAQVPNIVGVKEASGNFDLLQKTRLLCPEDFYIWSGNDDDTAAICLLGGQGVISTVANLIPGDMHRLTQLCLTDQFRQAGALQLAMKELISAVFCEVNPIPVKTALSLMGKCQEIFRLPLCPMQPENREKLHLAMEHYGLL